MLYDSDIINLKLLDAKLTSQEVHLYLYLYWKRDYKTNIVYITYEQIMSNIKISNKKLKSTLEGLKEKGYIDIIPKKINGMSTSYSYRLLVDLEYKGNIPNKVDSIDDFTINTTLNDYTCNTELKEVILAYIKMRSKTKPISSIEELNLVLNKLNRIGSTDKDKIAIIENSTINKWADIYPLEQAKGQKKGTYHADGEDDMKCNTTDRRI